MLDSSMALMLLILLGVIILVILSVMFLLRIGNLTNDVEKNLNAIDKSIYKLKSKIDTNQHLDTVARRVETTIREAGNVSGELQERQPVSDGEVSANTVFDFTEMVKPAGEVDEFLETLEGTEPDNRQVGVISKSENDRNRFGFTAKNDTIAVDISEIREEPVHSIDDIMANFVRPNVVQSIEPTFGTTQAVEPQTRLDMAVKNVEEKINGLDSVINANNGKNTSQAAKVNNNEIELSFAERLKKEAQKMKKEEFSKEESVQQAVKMQPVVQEKVIKSIDAVGKPENVKATPHFVDRVSGIDRQGRVYSVEQLKEQIK